MALQFAPFGILRGAGFPIELLLSLATPEVGAAAANVAKTRAGVERRRVEIEAELAGALRTGLERHVRRRVRKSLRDLRPFSTFAIDEDLQQPWNDAIVAWAEARAEADRVAEEAEQAARSRVAEIAKMPSFAEAVWLSSSTAYEGIVRLDPEDDTAKSRERRRLAVSYLQRFSAKNEMAGFFGPINFVRCAPGLGEPVGSSTMATRVVERRTFVSRHVIDRVLEAARSELATADAVPLEVHPLLRSSPAGLGAGGTPLPLPDGMQEKLLSLSGAPRSAWVAAFGADAVDKLLRARVIRVVLEIPTTSLFEADDAEAVLRSLSDPGALLWCERIRMLRSAADSADRAVWPHRRRAYEAAAQLLDSWGLADALERRAGTLYADRAVFFEEAIGGASSVVVRPAALVDRFPSLELILRVHAVYAARVRRDAREWIRSVADAAGLGGAPSLLDLAIAVETRIDEFAAGGCLRESEAFWRSVSALVLGDGGPVDLDPRALEELLDGEPEEPFVCSPDLLVRAPRGAGEVELVLGEVHHGAQVWSSAQRLAPASARAETAEALRRWSDAVADGARLATLLDPRQTGKAFTLEWPGITIERNSRSSKRRGEVVRLNAVTAGLEPEFTLRDGKGSLVLAPTSPVDPLVRAFGRLVLWGPRSLLFERYGPRVNVGDLVWFRESWRIRTDSLLPLWRSTSAPALVEAATALRQEHGLPRFVFLKGVDEPKPVYCDFESIAFLPLVAALIRNNPEVVATEMLPAPDELWLACAGKRYTSELRVSILVDRR